MLVRHKGRILLPFSTTISFNMVVYIFSILNKKFGGKRFALTNHGLSMYKFIFHSSINSFFPKVSRIVRIKTEPSFNYISLSFSGGGVGSWLSTV